MANPTIQQNRRTLTDPDLADLWLLWKKELMLEFNCHHVATVTSFNSVNETVQATVNYKKTFFQKQADGTYAPILKPYAILMDLPIIKLKGGPASLTFPIAAGDECLILFNDRDIDNWFQTGLVQANASSRLHSFSDGFALVGISSLPNVSEDYDVDRVSLNYGTTRVAVGEEKVLIENETTTLNTLLQQLVNNIQDLVTQTALITVTCAAPGNPSSPPINAAAISAIATQLITTASDIGGLLE